MAATHDKSRRAVMTGMAGISLAAAVEPAAGVGLSSSPRSKILVVYFSRSGNTKVIAGLLQRAHDADVFELQPANPYPEEYLATVKQATEERDGAIEPPLAAKVPNMSAYETVYLGFPIWGETAPPLIRSFLKAHDLSNKTVIPFVTHGGYGLGRSQAVLVSHAPKARLKPPFSMQADQERQTMNTVNRWLEKQEQS